MIVKLHCDKQSLSQHLKFILYYFTENKVIISFTPLYAIIAIYFTSSYVINPTILYYVFALNNL